MGILKDFRTTLGDDPQPWHQRLLRAGVRPIELAEAVQRYLRDQQQVTDDGITVPNVLRITLGTQDHERLGRYGVVLPRALGAVVVETADERDWMLSGPVKVRIEHDEAVSTGTYRLAGRIEPVDGWGEADPDTAAGAGTEPDGEADPDGPVGPAGPMSGAGPVRGPDVELPVELPVELRPTLIVRTGVDAGEVLTLEGGRLTAGRGEGCDLIIRDTTVSREHAAFVLRGETWWVLDLGSTNGTRVNGLRAAEHPVVTGDRIELGDVLVELVDA
jgi:hypothetical protein